METAIVLVALIAFVGFREWLKHHRRVMIHQERLHAIEKGVELPPLEQEVKRSSWNVQRMLLLAGLIWISLGIGVFVVLNAVLAHPEGLEVRQGLQWLGLAPALIGLSHLIIYLIGKKKEK